MKTILLLLFGFFLAITFISVLVLMGQRALEEWDKVERKNWGVSKLPDWYWHWARDVPAWVFAGGVWGTGLTLLPLISSAIKG